MEVAFSVQVFIAIALAAPIVQLAWNALLLITSMGLVPVQCVHLAALHVRTAHFATTVPWVSISILAHAITVLQAVRSVQPPTIVLSA